MGNPKISPNCESPIIGRDSACLPELPLHLLAMVVVLPSLELSLQRGCPSSGDGGITYRSSKEALRKIL